MPLSPFSGLDEFSRIALRRLASNWRQSPTRPVVDGRDALAWHSTLQSWVHDPSMPLLVHRPRDGRGREIFHPSGRVLIPTDHAPAHYLLSLAIDHRRPTRDSLKLALEADRFPIAVSLTAAERANARYTGTLAAMDAPNLHELGYSFCHVTRVGLRRMPLEQRTEVELIAHSLLFLSPVNMFVVPKEFAALGHLPEFVDEMDDARCFALNPN